MKSSEIRQQFLQFFKSKDTPSFLRRRSCRATTRPCSSPTRAWSSSGCVHGQETRSYSRATSSQRSVRAGGKHNDLENVGYTARHHTFFEMLGNFSFGDYFKRDAISYAWELLTQVYKLPAEKLWVTVYQEDDEAYDIWAKEVGVPAERIIRIGDNKGARAPTTSGRWPTPAPAVRARKSSTTTARTCGAAPGSPEEDGDRYIEIWNLVFMQFERDAAGNMPRLPRPCVDTGMGLERIAAVLQGVHSNYEIDLFQRLIAAAARETGVRTWKTTPSRSSPTISAPARSSSSTA